LDENGHKIFANKIIEHVYSFEIIITCDDFFNIFVATIPTINETSTHTIMEEIKLMVMLNQW